MADMTHARLMDDTYRYQRLIYDATRAWFLLGRDHLIAHLDARPGARVLEIACGTGRNLDHVARRYPGAQLYGLDISGEMLRSARAKLGARAHLALADACAFNPGALFGVAQFDRIILSYNALLENIVHAGKFLSLLLKHFCNRNICPTRHNVSNIRFSHVFFENSSRTLELLKSPRF